MKNLVQHQRQRGMDRFGNRLSTIISDWLKPLLEILQLLQDVDENSRPEEVLHSILEKARDLFNADRVEIALWDSHHKTLRIHAQSGKVSKAAQQIGGSISDHGVMMRAWKLSDSKARTLFEDDLVHGVNYFEVDKRTKSEAAIGLHHKGRKIGVLNLEWFTKVGWSDDQSAILELLAEQSALAINLVDRGAIIRDLAGSLASKDNVANAVCRVLERVSDHHGFDRALLYQADAQRRRLIAHFALARGRARRVARSPWSYGFDETSLAAHVFDKGASVFIPNPWKNKIPINRKGLRKFGIRGPLLALPLNHENVPLGVIVIWSHRGPKLSNDDSYALAPIADLLAAMLAPKSTAKPALVPFEILSDLLRKSQSAIDPRAAIEMLLRAVQAFGFERARFLRYDEGEKCFVRTLQLAIGVQPDDSEVRIATRSSKYAGDLATNFRRNPEARIYDPAAGWKVDPHHDLLGKSPQTPWIAAPVSFHGRLIGQLAADNENNRRPFSPFAQQFLTLAAGIASFVLDRVSLNNLSPLSELPIAMFCKDKKGRFLWMNRRFAEDCNSSIDAAKGATDLKLFGHTLAAIYRKRDREVMRTKKTMRWIEHNVTHNKSRWVHVVKTPLFDAAGGVIGVQGMYVEEAYRAIFQHAKDAIYQSTPQGRYLDVNPAMASLLGFKTQQEVLEANIDIANVYASPKDRNAFRAKVKRDNGVTSNFEYVLRRPRDSSLVKVSEDAWEVKNSEGELLYYEGIIRDISRQIRASASVSAAEEEGLSSGIARTIAHEVGNRISLASATSNVLMGELRERDPIGNRSYLQATDEITFHLDEARSVLEAYKAGEKSGIGPPAPVDATVQETVFTMKKLLYENGFIEPILKLNAKRLSIAIPTIRFRQILINLIKNSVEAADRNQINSLRKISICTRIITDLGSTQVASIEYTDTAGGMDPETENSLFRREDKGRGMLVVSKILDRYDGKIDLNTKLGRGSKFTITLPIEKAQT